MPTKSGVLDPERMYSTAALQRVGIGRTILFDARQSGIVKPYVVGREDWYSGAELIEYIKLQRRKGAKKYVGPGGSA